MPGNIFRCLDLPTTWKDVIVQDCGIDNFNAWKLSGQDRVFQGRYLEDAYQQ